MTTLLAALMAVRPPSRAKTETGDGPRLLTLLVARLAKRFSIPPGWAGGVLARDGRARVAALYRRLVREMERQMAADLKDL